MPTQSVLKMGNKQLAQPSLAVENFSTAALFNLIQDMKDTMKEKGGVGIAAPQIGYQQRVIMFGFEHSKRYPNEKPIPFTILINPVIEILDQAQTTGWEGCLSVPGIRGLIPRYNKIKYTAYDPEGNLLTQTVAGFHARVIQHECDHLDGILFPRRIVDMQFLGFEDELINAGLIPPITS